MGKLIEERKETWREGIKITDMKEGDLIYIQKHAGGMGVMITCKFIKYKKGIVYAEIIELGKDYEWLKCDFPKGKVITARKKKCMLWGRDESCSWAHCMWFK